MADIVLWTAIGMLFLGLVLLLVEIFNPGFFAAVPGGALAVGGGLAIAAPGVMFGNAGWILWPLLLILATVLNLYAYKRWAPPSKAPITLSTDSLPGHEGQVVRAVVPDATTGKVRIRGTTWSATADAPIPAGTKVRVVRTEGVHLVVEPAPPPS